MKFQWDRYQQEFLESSLKNGTNIVLQAGPGSGKTAVLLEKIKRLHNEGKTWLYIVYNVSARADAKARLQKIFSTYLSKSQDKTNEHTTRNLEKSYRSNPNELSELPVFTFHGYIWNLIKQKFENAVLLPEVEFNYSYLSAAKNIENLGDAGEYQYQGVRVTPQDNIEFIEIGNYKIFTYDLVLQYFDKYFKEFEKFLSMDVVVVDEMQDLDTIQLNILRKIFNLGKSLILAGDLNQSIYSFRDVDINKIIEFTKDFKRYELKVNYRSKPHIVKAVNRIFNTDYMPNISSDIQGFKGTIHSQDTNKQDNKQDTNKIPLLEFNTDKQEASYITHFVYDVLIGTDSSAGFRKKFDLYNYLKLPGDLSASDIAIIARTNKGLQPFIQEFNKLGLPFYKLGTVSNLWKESIDILQNLYLHAIKDNTIKDTYKDFSLAKESITLGAPNKDINNINYVKYIFYKHLQIMDSYLQHQNKFQNSPQENKSDFKINSKTNFDTNFLFADTKNYKKGQLDTDIESVSTNLIAKVPEISIFLDYINNCNNKKSVLRARRLNNQHVDVLHRHVDVLHRHVDVLKWLEYYLQCLQEFTQLYKSGFFISKIDKLNLATIHASKGLEFRLVFLVGVNDNLLPYKFSQNTDEEKRLFYVAVSRAKEGLVISYNGEQSRFLGAVKDLVVNFKPQIKTNKRKKEQLSLF